MSPEIDPRVGPVLEAGDVGRAVAAAIQQQNTEVSIEDHRAYLRVLCPHRCEVSARAIGARLGRDFILPGELEQVMPSFRGDFRVDEDMAVWSLRARR